MISRTAIEDLEALRERGVSVAFEDVIRLNALGLKLERNETAGEWFAVPRAAIVGGVSFRQPTIAHEIWLTRAGKLTERDNESVTALQIYALTRPADRLCDPCDAVAIRREVEAALQSARGLTYAQVDAALTFVIQGARDYEGEYATAKPEDLDGNTREFINAAESIAVGYVHDALVYVSGVSLADALRMTASELYAVTVQAKLVHGFTNGGKVANRLRGEYYKTLDEIEAKGAANGGQQD